MRIIFMGTPALAIPSLELLAREHEIVLVVTQPDKPGGRGHKLLASPVKEYALAQGFAVLQPVKAREPEFIAQLHEAKPDAIAVVAYGQILPQEILDLPQRNFAQGGCVNLHFSLLPRWRGAAPVQYAIWKGDASTGVTTQWMAQKLDAGDVILQHEVAIVANETSASLFGKLTPLGAQVLAETMRLIQRGNAPRLPQDEALATLAPSIKKEDARIIWTSPANEINRQIHALNPRPLAWCLWKNEPMKILLAAAHADEARNPPGEIIGVGKILVATGSGVLELIEVQPPGKPRMNAGDWARGAHLKAGNKLE
jgi:methionyl-tRNA formyltransferase